MATRIRPIRRGEVWRVNLDPAIGAEQRKTRPVVVISRDDLGVLPIRIVVPVTGWRDQFSGYPWMVRVEPAADNGLHKTSAADVMQVRVVSHQRFVERLGLLNNSEVAAIARALAAAAGAE